MSLPVKLVLWHADLFSIWARFLTPREWKALVLTCRRWRLLAFRPIVFFHFWSGFANYEKTHDRFLVTRKKPPKGGIGPYFCVRAKEQRWRRTYRTKKSGLLFCKEPKTAIERRTYAEVLFFLEAWGQIIEFLPDKLF